MTQENLSPAPIDLTISAPCWDAEIMSETYLRIAHWERPSYFTRIIYDPESRKMLVFYYGNYIGTLHSPQQLWDLVKAGYSDASLSAWRRAQEKRFGLNRPKTQNTVLPPELQRISEARDAHKEWKRQQLLAADRAKAEGKKPPGIDISLEDLDIKI